MNNITLLHPHLIEKAKRRAQAMIFEAFSGVNGVEYCNCRDEKLHTNRLYIPITDKGAIEALEDPFYKNVDVRIFDQSIIQEFETMPEDHYLAFDHGSLYLPHPYIPSTSSSNDRFGNELYYWDSYLYVLCLLSFDQAQDAMGIIRNFCYQLKHYGMVLNGNRTYYLGRSQPPFLSSMVMAVYDYLVEKHIDNAKDWLSEIREYLILEYEIWEKYGFHDIDYRGKSYRLARYFDRFNFLSPEAMDEDGYPESILGLGYEKISKDYQGFFIKIKDRWYFRSKPKTNNSEILARWEHSKQSIICNRTNNASERASGIDTSEISWENRCAEIFPICLNSLLWKLVSDLNKIAIILDDGADRYAWREKQDEINYAIQNYLWNDEIGVYQNRFIDGVFTKTPYITTIYPLMFGLTSRSKAHKIASYVIDNLVTPYGIKNCKESTEHQWDYGLWGIMAYFLNKSYRMYRTIKIKDKFLDRWAEEITISYINNVVSNYQIHGTFYEKYNADNGSPKFKYNHYGNQKEFVWTAATLITLLHRL